MAAENMALGHWALLQVISCGPYRNHEHWYSQPYQGSLVGGCGSQQADVEAVQATAPYFLVRGQARNRDSALN